MEDRSHKIQSQSYEYAYSDESSNEKKAQNSDSDNSFVLFDEIIPINPLLPRTYFQEDSYYTVQNIQYSPLPKMLSDPFFMSKNKTHPTPVPNKIIDEDIQYQEYQTLQNKYPLNSENIVYQRFKHKKHSQFNKLENSSYSGQIYVIKSSQKKKRQLKRHELCEKNVTYTPLRKVNFDNPQEANKESEEHTLIFNSKFESGNLFVAFKQSETEYDLILQSDINSKGNTQ